MSAVLRETDSRFVRIETKVGAFVVLAILGMAAALAFIGLQSDLFEDKTRVYARADSASGLNEGMPVKLSGFRIGKVAALELDDSARVTVELSVNTRYLKWLHDDARARLLKEGLIGESVIGILPGSSSAPLRDGAVIPFEREKELADVVAELREQVLPIAGGVRELVAYLNDPAGDVKTALAGVRRLSLDLAEASRGVRGVVESASAVLGEASRKVPPLLTDLGSSAAALSRQMGEGGDLKAALANLRALSADLAAAGGRLDGLVAEADAVLSAVSADLPRVMGSADRALGAIADGAPPVLEKADRALGSLESIAARVDGELPSILLKIGQSLESLRETTEQLNRTMKEVAPGVSEIMEKGTAVAEGSQEVLDAVKGLWPISTRIEKPADTLVGVPSDE